MKVAILGGDPGIVSCVLAIRFDMKFCPLRSTESDDPWAFEKWLERRNGARYVVFATLIGVVIAILLGMASLALGGYQAWVGYQQWQHPISSSG